MYPPMRGFVLARKVIADGAERRVQNGTVQALVVVGYDQLPVGLHLIFDASKGRSSPSASAGTSAQIFH